MYRIRMTTDPDVDAWVARRLKQLRSERGITLNALSEQTGISSAHLSRLENGDRQPSIGSLLQISRVYGVSVSQLVQEESVGDFQLVRAEAAMQHSGQDGRYTVLSGARTEIAIVRVEIAAGKRTKDVKHAGEEWLHVLAGEITFHLVGKDVQLYVGDSVHFDSSHVHRVTNGGEECAVVLIASTAATMPMHHPVPASTRRR